MDSATLPLDRYLSAHADILDRVHEDLWLDCATMAAALAGPLFIVARYGGPCVDAGTIRAWAEVAAPQVASIASELTQAGVVLALPKWSDANANHLVAKATPFLLPATDAGRDALRAAIEIAIREVADAYGKNDERAAESNQPRATIHPGGQEDGDDTSTAH